MIQIYYYTASIIPPSMPRLEAEKSAFPSCFILHEAEQVFLQSENVTIATCRDIVVMLAQKLIREGKIPAEEVKLYDFYEGEYCLMEISEDGEIKEDYGEKPEVDLRLELLI